MRALDEVEGFALIRSVEERSVEVHDDEDAAWLREADRIQVCLGDVEEARVGHTARGFAGRLRRGSRGFYDLLVFGVSAADGSLRWAPTVCQL